MRLIDRLQKYLQYNRISAYAFEHQCQLSNGYLGKQIKGKGTVGSDILEKIKYHYPDVSIIWLLTGKGSMLLSAENSPSVKLPPILNEEQQMYFTSKEEVIKVMNREIERLQAILADKDKIISLLENKVYQPASNSASGFAKRKG